MKRIETLIDLSRKATENSDFTDSTGIQTEEFIQYFSDAIRRIESVINLHHPRAFLKEKTISVAQDEEELTMPADVFLGSRLVTVRFSSGNASSSFTFTGTTTIGSSTILTTDTRVSVGAIISGVGIPNGAVIVSVNPGVSLVMTSLATAAGTIQINQRDRTSINEDGFYLLQKASLQERISGVGGTPVFYMRSGNKIILRPRAQGGGNARLTYQQSQPAADIRRGEILNVVSTATQLTVLELDPASVTAILDVAALNAQNYLTIIDRDGNIKMSRVPISSVDETTGTVTLFGGAHTFETGETASIGNFVCAGPYSSNVCLLPDIAERYLLSYVNWKIFRRDSNVDVNEENMELLAIEKDIVDSFKEPDSDVDYIPILDAQYVGVDDYGTWY